MEIKCGIQHHCHVNVLYQITILIIQLKSVFSVVKINFRNMELINVFANQALLELTEFAPIAA
jgi:hypothetical protein